MKWQALWVGPEEATPRNFYWRVRREFRVPANARHLCLAISADSRYVCWLNGHYLGHGPVRAFPGAWSFDRYDLGGRVRDGLNCLAVVVYQPGTSTFQYILGRTGFIAEVRADEQILAASGASWRQSPHPAYDRRCTRMSCQQAFDEVVDGRLDDPGWLRVGYDDRGWDCVQVLGQAGGEPWGELRPRPVPFLTYERRAPRRLLRQRLVRPPGHATSLDLSDVLLDGDRTANPAHWNGLVATVLQASEATEATCHGPGPLWLNGEPCAAAPKLALAAGDNLLVAEVSGRTHDRTVNFCFDWPEGVTVKLQHPRGNVESVPWVAVGPFADDAARQQRARALTGRVDLLGEASAGLDELHVAPVQVNELTMHAKPLPTLPPGRVTGAFLQDSEEVTWLEAPVDGDRELLVDFGQELVGYLQLQLNAPAGTIVDLCACEYLDPDAPDRIQWSPQLRNTFRYTCRAGWQSVRSLVRRGFRYLMLTVRFAAPRRSGQRVGLRRLHCHYDTYPYEDRADFHCDDARLNRIWEISRETVRLCSEDTFVDCPAYEQTFWVGDARNESLFAYYGFGDYRLARRCLLLAGESLNRSPLVESQVPSGWENILTAWSLLWQIACWEYYWYSADRAFLDEIFPALEQQCNNLRQQFTNEDGLLAIDAWNMLDWAPMDTPNSGVVTHQNCWLVAAYRRAGDVAETVGQAARADEWRGRAEDLAAAINRHLWSDEPGGYTDCLLADGSHSQVFSQQTQVIASLCDVVPPERRERVDAILGQAPTGWVEIGSPFMMTFQLEALADRGDYSRILGQIRTWWGLMLAKDATSCWETFPSWNALHGDAWPTRSHCHAWSAAPALALPAWVAGVRPLSPGFRRFLVAPHPGDLRAIRATVPTPEGRIHLRLTRDEQGCCLWLTVPAGHVAEVAGRDYPAGEHRIELSETPPA